MSGVIVIGACSGFGMELALALRGQGVTVVLADRPEPLMLDAVESGPDLLHAAIVRKLTEDVTAAPIPYPAFPVYLGKRWPRRVAYRVEARPREQRTKRGKR
jgi:NAD(P)-dependent dehydrogenase (short-subunit alcohol dehydrogenase family)